jgi:putative redox protein
MTETGAMRAQVDWLQGMQFVARGQSSGIATVLDGSPDHGGLGSGIRPMEALLYGLGACTAMDVISILEKKQQRVLEFRVEVSARREPEHPRRFTSIELVYVLRGIGLSPDAVARAIELSQTRYCSASASLNAEITHSFRIEAEEPAS